ncbi:hypothetical protein FOA52_001791 [Chlamydomonas sp. UWO 241]|nr:hypothetical protein FOA52_001791 [Chlamydomonas sp. UWO 241]
MQLRNVSVAPYATPGRVQAITRVGQRDLTARASKPRQQANPLTTGLVAVLTEGLRLAGVGKARYEEIAAEAPKTKPLRPGDVKGLVQRISLDFTQNAYIITGVIDDAIYDADCYFADPTVAFSGVALWKRNLQLLVPFLLSPRVELLSIAEQLPATQERQRSTTGSRATGSGKTGRGSDGAAPPRVLRSEWVLETTLKLPWRPRVSVIGATEYTLNADANQVERHVETWNISGTEAVLQILRPGPKG